MIEEDPFALFACIFALILGILSIIFYIKYKESKSKWENDSKRQKQIEGLKADTLKWFEESYQILQNALFEQKMQADWGIEVWHSMIKNKIINNTMISFGDVYYGLVFDEYNKKLFFYESAVSPDMVSLYGEQKSPQDSFTYFTIPYSEIFKVQLVYATHDKVISKKKGDITIQKVCDEISIVIQTSNLEHPIIKANLSNKKLLLDAQKNVWANIGRLFDSKTSFSMGKDYDSTIEIFRNRQNMPVSEFALSCITNNHIQIVNQIVFRLESIIARNNQ